LAFGREWPSTSNPRAEIALAVKAAIEASTYRGCEHALGPCWLGGTKRRRQPDRPCWQDTVPLVAQSGTAVSTLVTTTVLPVTMVH
jgi:hypothetical protein